MDCIDNRINRRATLVIALLVSLFVAACGSAEPAADASAGAAQPSGAAESTTISVSGAFALFPLMTLWADEYQKLHPNVQFDVQAGGAGKGMTDMLSGAADIAMLSREPRPEETEQGIFLLPVTVDSVLGTANAKNPYLDQLRATGVTSATAAGVWISAETKTWGHLLGIEASDPINAYTRSDSAGAAEMWAKFLGAQVQEDLKGVAVNGDPGVAEAVRQDVLGIGYNNVGFTYDPATGKPIDGLVVVPIDLNGDGKITSDEDFYATRDEFTAAVADGRYPFPPARVLYLVTKGEPNPAIKEFFRWVLGYGQQYVKPAGYVALTSERIAAAAASLGK